MAKYHIEHDLRDAMDLPGIGCGGMDDWQAVFVIVQGCVARTSDRLAVPDFAATMVGLMRDNVHNECLNRLKEIQAP